MKRLTALLLGLLLLACAGNTMTVEAPPSAVPTAAPTATPAAAPTVPPTAAPTPTPEPTPEPTLEPTPEPTPTPVPTPFTIVWISDTQNDSWHGNGESLKSISAYVVAERESKNIQAVLQTGDLVEIHDKEIYWQRIEEYSAPMREAVPFYCVSGNHDIGAYFKHLLSYEPYLNHPLCCVTDPERQFEGGKCWYELREDLGLLLVGMGWALNARDQEAFTAWIGDVLAAHEDYPAILLVHSFLFGNAEPDGNGQYLVERLLPYHPNLRLIVCGHHDGARRWSKTFDDGHTVNAVMVNFQDDPAKSRGYCQWLTFDPVTRDIAFTVYSPFYDDYNYYGDLEDYGHQFETFTLQNAW